MSNIVYLAYSCNYHQITFHTQHYFLLHCKTDVSYCGKNNDVYSISESFYYTYQCTAFCLNNVVNYKLINHDGISKTNVHPIYSNKNPRLHYILA